MSKEQAAASRAEAWAKVVRWASRHPRLTTVWVISTALLFLRSCVLAIYWGLHSNWDRFGFSIFGEVLVAVNLVIAVKVRTDSRRLRT